MADRVWLDPSELAGSRTQVELTPWIRAEGLDWGDGDVESFRASGEYGDSIIDYRLPSRQVTIPLMVKTVGGTAFATIRSLIQAKAALYQQSGGWLKRVTSSGGTLYADIQTSGLKLSGGWFQAHKDADTDAQLTLEVSPDFYGNAVQLADHVETSLAELVFTETTVSGDYPARVRVVVDEDQGQAQLGLIWGFRKRNYSSAATARLAYEAEALQPLDTATKVALTGASGGTVVTHGTLSTNWTPVLNMNLGGTAYLTHVGSYRWWCRYRTTSGTAVQLRGVYDVGDLVLPEENPRWTHPAAAAGTAFYIADLGQVRLDQVPVGTHRWAGVIQGKGDAGGENVSIDRVWFQPLDESAGLLRAPIISEPGLATFSARDGFDQTAGALTGKTAPVGGVWAGTGDADDFSVETTGDTAQRTAVSDTVSIGRFATLDVNLAATVAQVDFKWSADAFVRSGLLARFSSTSSLLRLYATKLVGQPFFVRLELNGSTLVNSDILTPFAAATWYTIRLYVDAGGRYRVWFGRQGSALPEMFSGWDSAFATGGAQATGDVGIYDEYTDAAACTRNYDNFLAWVPAADAVLNPSQSAELRWDGIVREDTGGTAYGPVSWIEGDLPRLPPTTEGGTVEVFLKASRGDFQSFPDTGIDDISARATNRYCWLHPNS